MITKTVNDTIITYDAELFELKEEQIGFKLVHLKKDRIIYLNDNVVKFLQLSERDFICIERNKYSKEFDHFHIDEKNYCFSYLKLKIKSFDVIDDELFLFSFSDESEKALYNPRLQIIFMYPFMSVNTKCSYRNGKKVYIGYIMQNKILYKLYFTGSLKPILIQNTKNNRYKIVDILDNETEKEALDRVLASFKQERRLVKTNGQNKL